MESLFLSAITIPNLAHCVVWIVSGSSLFVCSLKVVVYKTNERAE